MSTPTPARIRFIKTVLLPWISQLSRDLKSDRAKFIAGQRREARKGKRTRR